MVAGIIEIQSISSQRAREVIEQLAGVEWKPSSIATKHDVSRIREFVDSQQRDALSAGFDRASDICKALLEETTTGILHAIKAEYGLTLKKISAPQFTKYQQGHFIAPHRDTGQAYPNRIFSAVTYLSDDYQGGEIDFPTIGKSYLPKSGTTLVFPADMLHAVKPVKSGVKQIFLFFIDKE